jgi:hypothetical protein
MLKERVVDAETVRMLSNGKLGEPDKIWRISHLRTILTVLASVRRKGCKNKKLTTIRKEPLVQRSLPDTQDVF